MSKDEHLRRRSSRISDRQRKREEEEIAAQRVAPIARQGKVASTIGESLLPEFEERAKTKIRSTDPEYLENLSLAAERGLLTPALEEEYKFAISEGIVKPYKGDKYRHLYNKAVEVRESNRVRDFGLTDNELDTLSASQQGKWGDRGLTGLREFQNSTTFGNADRANAAALDVDRNDNSVLQSTREAARLMRDRGVKDYKLQATRMTRGAARARNPYSAAGGEIAGYLAPGAIGMKATTTAARYGASRIGLSTMSRNMTPIGNSRMGRIGRYVKDVLPRAAAGGAVDGAMYGATIARSNREADEMRDIDFFSGENAALAAENAKWGAAFGIGASALYRTGRAAATKGVDVAADILHMLRKTPLSDRPIRAGGSKGFWDGLEYRMTPQDRRAEVLFENMRKTGMTFDEAMYVRKAWEEGRMDDAKKALDPVYTKALVMIDQRLRADGLEIDDLANRMRELSYPDEDVTEAFFEIAALAKSGKTQALANALATVAGPGRKISQDYFDNRSMTAIGRVKNSFNKAFGVNGSEFYGTAREVEERGQRLVTAAYKNAEQNGQLKDETWTSLVGDGINMSPLSEVSIKRALVGGEDGGAAAELAYAAGDNASGNQLRLLGRFTKDRDKARAMLEDGQLKLDDAQRMLDRGRDLGDQGLIDAAMADMAKVNERLINPAMADIQKATERMLANKPSVAAFKYIDEQLTHVRNKANQPGSDMNPLGVKNTQERLRAMTDGETLLKPARDLYAKYEFAAKAFEEGRRMFSQGTDIESLMASFERQIAKYDSVDPEILPALITGFVRGAEDAMATAGGVATALNRLNGSKRAKEKLAAMLDDAIEMAGKAGIPTNSMTKAKTALLGGERDVTYVDGTKKKGVTVPGRLAREWSMQDSKNQTTRGSQTAARFEAVRSENAFEADAQGLANDVAQAAQGGIIGLAWRFGSKTVGRVARSNIHNKDVNEALSNIMFRGGREHLDKTLDDLRKLRAARTGKADLDQLSPLDRQKIIPSGGVGSAAVANAGGRKPPTPPQGPPTPQGGGPKRIGRAPAGPPTADGTLPVRISARQGRQLKAAARRTQFGSNESGSVGFDVAGGLAGASAGFMGGADMNDDGEISLAERLAGAAIGGVGGYMGVRMIRDPKFRGNEIGAVGDIPKTPQQAAKMKKAMEASTVRMTVGSKAADLIDRGDGIPLRASPADMLKAIADKVTMTGDEKQAFMRVFGDKVKITRGDAGSFFETAADPRNHFSHKVDGFGDIANRMTDEELSSLSSRTAPQVVSILEDLRRISPVKESAAVAVAGGAKKGWYLRSQQALQQIFGDDAPRFAAVLAALSPQTSVESNLANTVNFWANWTRAGRPTDEKSILRILGQSVQGNKGDDSVLGAWQNNTVRAIQAVDPEEALLSGPKVDSFRRNLRGRNSQNATSGSNQPTRRGANSVMDDTEYAVTNDAWMANYFNVDQEMFARGGGKALPGYSAGYLATNVYAREVADHLTKVTGETWTPREVQETIWSWAKTLYEARSAAGETRSAAELIGDKALTDLQIGGTPDFAILLSESTALREVLKEAGYGRQLEDLAGASGTVYGNAPGFVRARSGPQDATGSGIAQRDYERRLGRAAGRLDDLAKRRASDARAERVRTTRSDFAGDGAAPRAYTRGSGGDGQTVRVLGQPVAATYTPERAYQSAYAKNQIEMPDVHELPANVNAGAAYAKRMQEAATRSKFGAAVNVYSPEEYADMRLFVAADGQSGFALKGDDIVSVWSDPKGPSGRTDALLPLAVQMGGRRLDAFDTVLPEIYAKHGFRIESRLGWNDEFAPTGWDKGTFARFNNGEPDVVFMVWDPAYKGAPRSTDGARAESYEDAVAVQAEAQRSIADRIASGADTTPPAKRPGRIRSAGLAPDLSSGGDTGRRKRMRDLLLDAAPVAGLLSLQPQEAEAEGTNAELSAANQRVTDIEAQITAIEEETIPALEEQIRLLQDPKADPFARQEVLLNRGHKLGNTGPKKDGVDGVIGDKTRDAMVAEVAKIEADIRTRRADKEGLAGELDKARKRRTDIELQQVTEEGKVSPMTEALREVAPWLGSAAGIAWMAKGRHGAVVKSRVAAQAAAQRANDLISKDTQFSRAKSGPNTVSERAAKFNEFMHLGGAGENVQFKERIKDGATIPRPRAAELSSLFPDDKRMLRDTDYAWMGGGLFEAGLAQSYVMEYEERAEKARKDIERYHKAGDVAGAKMATGELKKAENMLAISMAFRSLGLAVAGGRAAAAGKMKYEQVRPYIDMPAAEEEKARLLAKAK